METVQQDKYADLIRKKKQIESELSAYTKDAFSAAQNEIRRKHANNPGRSLSSWFACREVMYKKRQQLINQKEKIEGELLTLKPIMKIERQSGDSRKKDDHHQMLRQDGSLSFGWIALQLLGELQKIRQLLEDENNG